ncbi:MAG: FMN-binding protein [Prevotella sp.]|nr:FMN-binding protein [Prevotella sp.]
MKKYVLLSLVAVALMSAGKQDGSITKENGYTIVNTTTIAKDVEGYNGPVPLKIYIKKNKIEKIEVLKNQETPKYMVKVKKAIENAWDGLTVKEAKSKKVDAVTGATFTSEAIIKNVQKGLDHYQNNK